MERIVHLKSLRAASIIARGGIWTGCSIASVYGTRLESCPVAVETDFRGPQYKLLDWQAPALMVRPGGGCNRAKVPVGMASLGGNLFECSSGHCCWCCCCSN